MMRTKLHLIINDLRKHMNLRNPVVYIVIVVFALGGCVAVWGGAHKIVSADSNGMRIRYDSGLTSSARTSAIAREHCKKFGKIAEPVDAEMPGALFGIIEETYVCKLPESTTGTIK
jgi:hypothetical protein